MTNFCCFIIYIFTKSTDKLSTATWAKLCLCVRQRYKVSFNNKSSTVLLFSLRAMQQYEYLVKNCVYWIIYLHGSGFWRYFISNNCSTFTSVFVCPVVIGFLEYYFSCWSKTRMLLLQSFAKWGQISLLSVVDLTKSLGLILIPS